MSISRNSSRIGLHFRSGEEEDNALEAQCNSSTVAIAVREWDGDRPITVRWKLAPDVSDTVWASLGGEPNAT